MSVAADQVFNLRLETGNESARPSVATVTITVLPPAPCVDGVAVVSPERNPELVSDCQVLLQMLDVLAADGSLNWSGDTAIWDWVGIEVGGGPLRVRALVVEGGEGGGRIPPR